jgi:hypothetical protein
MLHNKVCAFKQLVVRDDLEVAAVAPEQFQRALFDLAFAVIAEFDAFPNGGSLSSNSNNVINETKILAKGTPAAHDKTLGFALSLRRVPFEFAARER